MKKILALILICIFSLNVCVFAAEFKDMPDDWSTAALETAVKNGLLTGNDGYIKASDNLTRAEMATIMVRACGALRTTDISEFTDVKADDWFFDSMSKAVAMGAFKGSDGKLNPNAPITRQEAFVVISRVFGVATTPAEETALDEFKDKDKVADWAKADVAAIIKKGYVAGSYGYISPLSNITRAEFAVVMDRLVKYYIDEPVDTIPTDGNVMIRTKDVDISGIKTDKLIVLADAIGNDVDINIENAQSTDKLIIRCGKNVSVSGKFEMVAVLSPGVNLSAASGIPVYVCKGSSFKRLGLLMGI